MNQKRKRMILKDNGRIYTKEMWKREKKMKRVIILGTDTCGSEIRTNETMVHILMDGVQEDSIYEPSMPFPTVNLLLPLSAVKCLYKLLIETLTKCNQEIGVDADDEED
jgi:hypothetical protein